MPVGRPRLRPPAGRYSGAMDAGSWEYGMVTNSRMPTSYCGSLDWKKTPERETLTEPRMSSKWSLLGSEGRMRINWVILQRRLPRRSVLEIGCFGELPVGNFFVIRSCWVAKGKPSFRTTAADYPGRV